MTFPWDCHDVETLNEMARLDKRSRWKSKVIGAGLCSQCGKRPLHTQTKCRECALDAAIKKHPAPVVRHYRCDKCGAECKQIGKGKQRRYCIPCAPPTRPRKGETYAYESKG